MSQPAVIISAKKHARAFWGDRFENRTGPVWQRLGPVHSFDERMSAAEALTLHNAMDTYREVPAFYHDPDSGNEVATGRKAILRPRLDGTYQYMTTVDNDFEVIQPADIAGLLDTPNGNESALTERWPVETLGMLPSSGGFFMTLHAGSYDMPGGDPMQRYFLIRNGNDGGTALGISIVHIRMACWNTMTAALKGASFNITIPHRRNALEWVRAYTQAIRTMPFAQDSVEAAMRRLANHKLSPHQINDIVEKTFKLEAPTQTMRAYAALAQGGATIDDTMEARFQQSHAIYERKIAHELEERRQVATLHEQFNDANPHVANTGWSIFNAITELVDNKNGRGDKDDRRDGAALDALFGGRAHTRDKAYEVIDSYIAR